jgi:hypothetical protein
MKLPKTVSIAGKRIKLELVPISGEDPPYGLYYHDKKLIQINSDLRQSPDAISLFKEGKYYAAAKEFLNNDDYRKSLKEGTGIAPRMERNVKHWIDLGNAKTLGMSYKEAVEERIKLLNEQQKKTI